MTQVLIEAHFVATVERTFSVLTDLRTAASRISGMQSLDVLTEGPIGVGTRFTEVRIMFGKEATETMEITQFEAGKGYTVDAESHGSHYTSVFEFTPEGDGTRVNVSFTATPLTFLAKVMSPLIFMMKGTMRKCMMQDMADLRVVIEADEAA
jgi:carbon monoxide dehydrogenase subunit G